MAKRNGGIIGPSNVPNPFIAKGVWKLRDAFNYIKAGLWPSVLGYQVNNSLRFNSGSSDYLSRTPAGTSSGTITTHSLWFKRSDFDSDFLYINYENGVNYGYIGFDSDSLDIRSSPGYVYVTTQKLRDPSAWYHLVVAVDNSLGTASDRVKIYLNGSRITSFSTQTDPTLNAVNNLSVDNTASNLMNVGGYSGGNIFGGYISEFNFIDGQALTPSSFGLTDSATGIWTPIAYTGSFGTNGFYLKFANSAALGTDSSGNGNNFTVNNLTSIDQSYDSPTNNFNTWNSLNKHASSTASDGNLTYTTSGTSQFEPAQCTIGFSAGKWYCEHKVNSIGVTGFLLGIFKTSVSGMVQSEMDTARFAYNLVNGDIAKNASNIQTGLATFTTNDILGIAVDITNGTLIFYKNGSQVGTTITDSDITNNEWTFGVQPRLCGFSSNFGNPPYAGGGYTDAGGFGNFSYQPPSGYYSLCTRTLAALG